MKNATATVATVDMVKFLACKGQFIAASWKTSKKPAAAHKGRELVKVTSGVFRAGVAFENIGTVKDAIAKGERNEVQPLTWGEWDQFPYTITHKGSQYVRLTKGSKIVSEYFVDGKAVSGDEFRSYLTPSDAKRTGNVPDVLTIKADNLISLG